MALALIIMLASFVAALGGRAQFTVARLGTALGRSRQLLIAALLTAALTAIAMALAGQFLALPLDGEGGQWLLGAALVLAAAELAWPVRIATPAEPTRSLGAITLVLLARQLLDAPRWFAFAGAIAMTDAFPAVAGAAIGAGLALLIGWLVPGRVEHSASLARLRLSLAIGSLLAALLIVFSL